MWSLVSFRWRDLISSWDVEAGRLDHSEESSPGSFLKQLERIFAVQKAMCEYGTSARHMFPQAAKVTGNRVRKYRLTIPPQLEYSVFHKFTQRRIKAMRARRLFVAVSLLA